MIRITLVALGLFFCLTSFAAAVTAPDPTDFVLVATRLTPAEEISFNDSDGAESSFWRRLHDDPCSIDYAQLIPSTNTRSGTVFDSDIDAQMSVWAAWGEKGLYLYFRVRDDNWVDCQDIVGGEGAQDDVEFYLDENSSEEQSASQSVFYYQRWTMTMVNYQWRFGGNVLPSTFSFNHLDPTWNQASGSARTSIKYSNLTFVEGRARGIFMEAFDYGDYIHRVQEWLIPWEHFSYNGIAVPSVGDKKAATFGYNDLDSNPATGEGKLCWKRSDPNSLDNCWGDIEFGPPRANDLLSYSNSGPCNSQPDPYPYILPRSISPQDSARGVSTSPTLYWSGAVTDSFYKVLVSTQPDLSTLEYDSVIHSTQLTLNHLLPDKVYYWQVFSYLTGTSSPVACFYTSGDSSGFSIPKAISPYNGEQNVSLPVSLSWTSVPWTTNYRVQISTTIDFSALVKDTIGTSSTAMPIHGLLKDKTYYWSVSAITALGAGEWSTTAAFTTMGALPDQVVLVGPPVSAWILADSVRLSWYKGSASSYRYALSIATDSNMTHVVMRDSILTDTSFLLRGLVSNVTYFWRVKAFNAAGWGTSSALSRFLYSKTAVLFVEEALPIPDFNRNSRTLTYFLPKQCPVLLSYYNLSGRLMSMVVNEIQAPGSHTIANPVATFSKGSYVQVFKAGEVTRKNMVVVLR